MAVTVEFSERFQKAVRRLDPEKTEAVEKALRNFVAEPRLPGLNFEKLRGTDYHSIRATKGFRIVLRQISRTHFQVVDVGGHDIYRTYG